MDNVAKAIEYLTENYDKPISEFQSYIDIIENEPNVLSLIQKQYRPTNIEINTVGAYLWGCSQNFYGDVHKNCSPLCIGSFPHDNTYETCQYSTWTYMGGNLINKFNVLSPKAYIYVDSNWESFTNSDIEKLKQSGIYYASVLKTKNSQHKVFLSMTSLDNLPIFKQYNDFYVEETSKKNYWGFIILFVIFVSYLIIGR